MCFGALFAFTHSIKHCQLLLFPLDSCIHMPDNRKKTDILIIKNCFRNCHLALAAVVKYLEYVLHMTMKVDILDSLARDDIETGCCLLINYSLKLTPDLIVVNSLTNVDAATCVCYVTNCTCEVNVKEG